MKINRSLNVHVCNACRTALDDAQFERCGVTFHAPLQLFFDYVCPKCAHRGRYALDGKPRATLHELLESLADFIDDDDRRSKIIPLRPPLQS